MAPSHRIYTFDLLRGLAVLTMMLAHSVYFFHTRDNPLLLNLENFGNTVSFVMFLLVSGAVTYISYFKHHPSQPVNRKRIFGRVMLFLLAYYILALIVTGTDLLKAEGFDRIRLVLNILSFRELPGFTEYFPPFIFFSLLIGIFPRLFAAIGRKLQRVIIVSLVAYGAGYLLYQVPTGSIIKPWLALFAGAEDLFRFPLLQYLPVYLLGLYWGHQTLENEGLQAKRLLCSRFFWWFTFLAAAAYGLAVWLGLPMNAIFSRWPPSLPFLALGLAFTFFAAWFFYWVRQLRQVALLRDFFLILGQNALGLFWSHIFLLSLFASAGGDQVSSAWLWFFLFVLLLVLSVALTTFLPFNFRLALTSIRGSHEEQEEALAEVAVFRLSKDLATEATLLARGLRRYFWTGPSVSNKRILKRRHQLGVSLLVLATAALVVPSTQEEIVLQRQERRADIWWSENYPYRQPFTLENPEQFTQLQPGTPVALQFDHQALVEQAKSRADGQDIKVVYWTGEEHLVANTSIADPNTTRAALKFQVPIKIEGGKAEPYFSLYYGSFLTTPTSTNLIEAKANLRAKFQTPEVFPLVAGVSKSWTLIGQPESDVLSFNLTSTRSYPSETVTYQILDTPVTGSMLRSSPTSWEADISVATLLPGAYRIQATLIDDKGNAKTSQITGFYRSAPLYVAWTNDWEGYDVNQTYLDAMEAIANQYQLPITHFFNPRVFITKTIRPQRAQALKQWLQRRLELGDGYGLHLHLFLDFVEAAGLTPKTTPNWGDNGSGYGVPLSAYTKDEQKRLIRYADDLLFKHGLPKTTMFRAGGWYANLSTLDALEELGFTVDSSARTKYQFGRNKLPGNWDIRATDRPYYPSRTNQNLAATTNAFSVLEIPDNGADSYAYSAGAMIDRFTVNFGTGILSEPQQVTYLSHPHWFDDKEQARVRQLFEYINRYTFTNDHGPVIFTTTEAIAEVWKHAP